MNCRIALLFFIFGLNTIDACDLLKVVEIPASGKFELELGPSDFVKNALCYWIIRPSNTNQMIHYKISQFNLPFDSECSRAHVNIQKDHSSSKKWEMCGVNGSASQGNFGPKSGREFTVEFETDPEANDADIQIRIVKVVFYSIAEDNNGRPIQVDSQYNLEFAKYPTIPRPNEWRFKANNPNNTIKFIVEKIDDINCDSGKMSITNNTDLSKNERPKYCGSEGNLRDELNNSPPSYEWLLERYAGYKLSIQFTPVGSVPLFSIQHSTCHEEPIIILVEDVYTLSIPRKVIDETFSGDGYRYEYEFTCRWIIRSKNPAKKLHYEIKKLNTPYGILPMDPNYWFEHLSIYPDYFAVRRPKIAGSINGEIGYLDGTEADLRSTTPAEQWNVNYQYFRYHDSDNMEFRIKFISRCPCSK
ncbi:uncharacterized protein LOC141908650 [Tubulanus polymorphus]|uniref:uncharacterized protein LOC141908650 n=1 Tax=Tubulanus polymorphus TaxID=672921 RepID=UPI003DA3E5E4